MSPGEIQTRASALKEIEAILDRAGLETSRRRQEAEELLFFAFDRAGTGAKSVLEFYTEGSQPVPAEAWQRARMAAETRAGGKPLAYVLGHQPFGENLYAVHPGVLIPRPETEQLVEKMKPDLKNFSTGLEVGVGSGAISIELMYAQPSLRMTATEASGEALDLARENGERILGAGRLELIRVEREEVLEPLHGRRFDFMVSNPPYLHESDEIDPVVLAHEPHMAFLLDDPLYFYQRFAEHAETVLRPGGRIYLELAAERADEVGTLFANEGWNWRIDRDLTARKRFLIGQFRGGQA